MPSRTLTLILAGDADKMNRTLRRAGGSVDKFGKKAGPGLSKILKVGALALGGLAVAGAAMGIKLAKDLLDTGDALDKMNRKTGLTVERIQELDFAAQQSGTSIGTIEKAFLRSTRVLGDASKGLATAEDTLTALGLSAQELADVHPDELFTVFAEAVSQVESPLEKAQLAQELFGKSGAELIPLLEGGAAGIEALAGQAREAGNIMSGETARAAAEFNDQLNILKQRGLAVVQRAFASLAPHLSTFVDFLLEDAIPTVQRVVGVIGDVASTLVAFGQRIRDNKPLVAGLVVVLGAVAAIALAAVLTGWASSLALLVPKIIASTAALWAQNAALLANPAVLIVAGIIALGAALVYVYKTSETFRNVVKTVFAAVKQIVALAVQAILGYVDLWLAGMEKIVGAASWLAAKFGINMDGVESAIGKAREFIAGAEDKIVDSLTAVGDAGEAAAVVVAAGVEQMAEAATSAAVRVVDITQWSADEQRKALESHYRGLDELHNAAAVSRLLRQQQMQDAVFQIDADAARRQFVFASQGLSQAERFLYDLKVANVETHTEIAEVVTESTTKTLSEADALASGMAVAMTNACGTVTGFQQCVDGMVVEFDADMAVMLSEADALASGMDVAMTNACGTVTGFEESVDDMAVESAVSMAVVLSEAEKLAAGMTIAMTNACGTITGFQQCVDGMVVEFDADMGVVLSDADKLASGMAVAMTNACGTVIGFKQCVDGVVVESAADIEQINAAAASLGGFVAATDGIPGSDGIPQLAHGGIVTRPTVVLAGESGPEAIIPLSRLGGGGRVELYLTVTVEGGVISAGDLSDVIVENVQLAADRGELRLGRLG